MSVVAPLAERPAVELVGPDARRFANGMFTNNVRDLPVGGAQRSAMADDKGRIIGTMDLLCLADDRFLLLLEGMSAADFEARYERYVVFDDVEIVDRGVFGGLTVQGDGHAERLAAAGVPRPSAGAFVAFGEGWAIDHDRGGAGVDVALPAGASLPMPPDPDGASTAEALRVWAGLVRFPDDIAAPALPHEHGLRDRVLHFEKGCYLGQEQIHRIEVMGKPRRSLALFHAAEPLAVGEAIEHDGKKVGTVSSVAPHPQQGFVGLAVVRKPAHEPGTSVTVGGRPATAVALPLVR